MALDFEKALPLIQQQTGNPNIMDALAVYNKNPSAYGTVGSEAAGIASLNLAPAQLAATKDFFAANPTADQIYTRATELNLSPQQIASAYAQATGGPYATGLQAVNQYLAETGKSFTGVPQLNLGSAYVGPEYEKATPATQSFINKAVGAGYTADMLTPEIATDLMRRSMTTGVPSVAFDMYGGIENVRKLYEKGGGGYDPSKFGVKYFSPSDIDAVKSFLGTPKLTADDIYKRAAELKLSPFQVAALQSEVTGTPFQTAFADVSNYLTTNKKSLPGGFAYIPSERLPYTVDASGKITTVPGTTGTGGISNLSTDLNALVTQAYKDVLGRAVPTTDSGLNYYIQQLQSGAIKPEDLKSSLAYGAISLADQLAAQKYLGKDIFGTESDLRGKFQTGFDQAITDVFGTKEDITRLESLFPTKDTPFSLSQTLDPKFFESRGSLEDIKKELQDSYFNKVQESNRAAVTAMNLYGVDVDTARQFAKNLIEGKETDPLAKEYYDALLKGTVTPDLYNKLVTDAAKKTPDSPYFKNNPRDLLLAKPAGEIKSAQDTAYTYGSDPKTGLPLIHGKAFNDILDKNGEVFIGGFQDNLKYENDLQSVGADPRSKYYGNIGRGTGALGVTASKDEIADFAKIEKELQKLGGIKTVPAGDEYGSASVDVVYIPQKDPETGQVNQVPIPAEQFFRMQLAEKYPTGSEEDPSSQARFERNFESKSAYDYYKDTKDQLDKIALNYIYKDPSQVPQYKDIKEAYDDLNKKTENTYLWRGRTDTWDPEVLKKLGIEDSTANNSHLEMLLEKKGDWLVPKTRREMVDGKVVETPAIGQFKYSDPNTSSGFFGDIFNSVMELMSNPVISMALGSFLTTPLTAGGTAPLSAATKSLAAQLPSGLTSLIPGIRPEQIASSLISSGISALPSAAGGNVERFGKTFLTNLAGSGVQMGAGALGVNPTISKLLSAATTAGLSDRDIEDALMRVATSEGINTLLQNVPTGDFDKRLMSAFMPAILSGKFTPSDIMRITQAVNPPKK